MLFQLVTLLQVQCEQMITAFVCPVAVGQIELVAYAEQIFRPYTVGWFFAQEPPFCIEEEKLAQEMVEYHHFMCNLSHAQITTRIKEGFNLTEK